MVRTKAKSLIPGGASGSLFALLTANFVLFGASMTIFGATIPNIIRLYGWSYSTAGVVLAASAIGYFSSTLMTGFLVKRVGARWMVVTTLCIEGISFLFFARFPSIPFNIAHNFLIGFGQGGTEVVSNVAVIRIERDGKSRLMNLLHASFCVGAFLGPIGVAGLLTSVFSWQIIFPAIGIVILCIATALTFQKFPSVEEEEMHSSPPSGELSSHLPAAAPGKWRLLLSLYFAVILLYVGVELIMSNWSAEFFVTRLGSASSTAAFMVAILWVGLFVGRLGLSFFYHGTRQEVVLLVLNVASTSFLLLMLLSKSLVASSILVFLIGVGLSGVYPLVMSLVGKRSQSTVAVGIVSTGGGIGSFCFPFILAFIADRVGLYRAFYFCFFVGVAMVIFTVAVVSHRKKHGTETQS